jgi:hypothetical protein
MSAVTTTTWNPPASKIRDIFVGWRRNREGNWIAIAREHGERQCFELATRKGVRPEDVVVLEEDDHPAQHDAQYSR